jgi:polyhydroxyalkanoate synthase subunit PhaC
MLGFHESKYDQYKFEYDQFIKSKARPQYAALSSAVNYSSEIANLMRYESLVSNGNIFLIVPSIFNSPEILFLSGENNFVQNLRQKGEVYLVNWQETGNQLKIEDLVQELKEIINFIKKNTDQKIHLIGHCIGGNICIAAAQNLSLSINSLSLLTTPWNFSHFANLKAIIESLELENAIKDKDLIPKIYVQIMFFLMFPAQYKEKIDKYFALPSGSREIFLQVEDWLQSGISIPRSLYLQIIKEFCLQNIIYNKKWKVHGSIVNPAQIDIPTCIIYAKKDQIVPYSSIVPLQKMIKTSTLIRMEGGHISYLISPNSDFQKKYNNWLENLI